MAPEYGATCGFFPVDDESLKYMKLTGRSDEHIALVKEYLKQNHMFFDVEKEDPNYTDVIELIYQQLKHRFQDQNVLKI